MEDNITIDLNDMYIDDSNFSFDQLEDGLTEGQIQDASLGAEQVSAEDLVDDLEGLDFEDEESSEEQAEEDSEEEEESEGSEEEEYEEEYEESEEADDEEEVDFEEYDVTLPSGEVVKLHEAISGYKSAQELQAEREAFESEKQTYEQSNESIKKMLDLAKLEAQRVIDDYDGFDWAALSREDPQAYVENREFLDKYKARHKEITAEMQKVESALESEKQEAIKAKAVEANNILAKEIPGWGRDMYSDLMSYAVNELHMEEDFVINSVDAGFFKALHLAKQMTQGKQTVKAKIKRINNSPKKVVKAAPKTVKPVNTKKVVINKKLESGQFDERDLGDMFGMLED